MSVTCVNVFATSVTAENLSRHELLAWVNDCLQSNLTRIEDMGTGAAYCHLTHFLFSSQIQLQKVKWNSRHEVDWINNWQILQKSWQRIGVAKPVPVQSLMKAKFQDNFEFLQWFKKFFDANYGGHEYDPLLARNNEEFPAALPGGKTHNRRTMNQVQSLNRTQIAPVKTQRNSLAIGQKNLANRVMNGSSNAVTTREARHSVASRPLTSSTSNGPRLQFKTGPTLASSGSQNILQATNGSNDISKALTAENAQLKREMDGLKEQVGKMSELQEKSEIAERERDFYRSKLRLIEIYCTKAITEPHPDRKVVQAEEILEVIASVDEQKIREQIVEANSQMRPVSVSPQQSNQHMILEPGQEIQKSEDNLDMPNKVQGFQSPALDKTFLVGPSCEDECGKPGQTEADEVQHGSLLAKLELNETTEAKREMNEKETLPFSEMTAPHISDESISTPVKENDKQNTSASDLSDVTLCNTPLINFDRSPPFSVVPETPIFSETVAPHTSDGSSVSTPVKEYDKQNTSASDLYDVKLSGAPLISLDRSPPFSVVPETPISATGALFSETVAPHISDGSSISASVKEYDEQNTSASDLSDVKLSGAPLISLLDDTF